MNRLGSWMAAISACIVIWNECAENPALFCYRIGWHAVASVRSSRIGDGAMVTNPTARHIFRCSNPSGIFSTRSTMLKD